MEIYRTAKGKKYAIVPLHTLAQVENVIVAEGMFLYRGVLKHWTIISSMTISTVRAQLRGKDTLCFARLIESDDK